MAKQKNTYFDFEIYPESAPDDWEQQLKDTHVPFAISPEHDDGKPHRHAIMKTANPVTLDYAKTLIPDGIAANGYLEPTHHPRNYQRYLIHLDDPDKQQFQGGAAEITVLNGFPLDLTRDYSRSELAGFRSDVFVLIRELNFVEYADLLDYLSDTGAVDLLDYASNHTILFNTYITSRREKARWEADE